MITAGPTYERIDPVRYIGNFSSGKMGFTLAEAFVEQGAEITLITGPVNRELPTGNINRIDVESAEEMLSRVQEYFQSADIFVMSAAVADYKPAQTAKQKIKKKSENWSLEMIPNADILKEVTIDKRPEQLVIGFALETSYELNNAREKLQRKNLDIIILNSLNDQGAGLASDNNKVTIITPNDKKDLPLKSKKEIAHDIVDYIVHTKKRDHEN